MHLLCPNTTRCSCCSAVGRWALQVSSIRTCTSREGSIGSNQSDRSIKGGVKSIKGIKSIRSNKKKVGIDPTRPCMYTSHQNKTIQARVHPTPTVIRFHVRCVFHVIVAESFQQGIHHFFPGIRVVLVGGAVDCGKKELFQNIFIHCVKKMNHCFQKKRIECFP